jgi:hypothetical protein
MRQMRQRILIAAYAAFALALAVFTGSALAGNGNGPPATPGNSGSAPGQANKAATPPAAAPAAKPAPAPAKHEAKQAEHAAKQAEHAAKQAEHAAKKSAPAPAKHTAADGSKQYGNGQSALQVAHKKAPTKNITLNDLSGPGNSGLHKVTICHNGHLITVDVHALKAHSSHLGGSDVIPATSASQCRSQSSTKAAAVEHNAAVTPAAPCAPTTTTENVFVPGYVLHHTGSKTNPFVKIKYNAHSAHVKGKHTDDVVVAPHTDTRTVTVAGNCSSSSASAQSSQAASQTSQAASQTSQAAATQSASASGSASSPAAAASAGGVLGATATLTKPAKKPAGGVLGATARLGKVVAGSRLPFTGLPLWIFVAVAAALILAGVAVRRTAGHRA